MSISHSAASWWPPTAAPCRSTTTRRESRSSRAAPAASSPSSPRSFGTIPARGWRRRWATRSAAWPPRSSAVEVALDGDAYRLRYVAVDPDAYHKYYNIVANPMLWFIQHYLWDLGRHPDIGAEEMDAWHNGYLVVNEQFAKAVVDEVRRGSDGQRAPRPGRRRERRAGAAPRLPALPRRSGRPGRLPRRLPASVHPHPLAAERLLAGARRSTSGTRSSRACWATTSSPSTRAGTRATSCTAARTCSTSTSTSRRDSCATRAVRCGCAPTR